MVQTIELPHCSALDKLVDARLEQCIADSGDGDRMLMITDWSRLSRGVNHGLQRLKRLSDAGIKAMTLDGHKLTSTEFLSSGEKVQWLSNAKTKSSLDTNDEQADVRSRVTAISEHGQHARHGTGGATASQQGETK